MASIYDNDKERQIHENAIHGLAHQYHLEEEWLRDIYQSELMSLKQGARVKGFLSVLSCHGVRETLRSMSAEQITAHTLKG